MTFGYIRRDDSGHWYLIPEEQVEEYDELQDEIEEAGWDSPEWYVTIDIHENTFGKYRIGGIYDLRVVMDDA